MQEGQTLAVTAEVAVAAAHALFLRSFHQHGGSAVAEERTGLTVLVVDDGRHLVGTDDDDLLHATALNHHSSLIERIEESATGSPEVERIGILQTELADNDAGGRWKLVVSGRGGDDEGIDGVEVYTRLLYQLLGSFTSHIARAETFLAQDATLLDAHTRHNPLVVGVYHARQFLVREDIVRHVATDAGDYRANLTHVLIQLLRLPS